MRQISKAILIFIGVLSVFLGLLGIILPLLPTTPLLLLAAACFVRSSPRLYNKLLNNKVLGPYIESFRSGAGIPLKSKIVIIALLWVTISYSIYMLDPFLVKMVLMSVAVGVTWFIFSLKTRKNERRS